MKLETVKTILLVVLIGISFILTYGLWSYQPNYDEVLNGDDLLEEADLGGKEETKQALIEPSQIIFHSNNKHYGFIEPTMRKNLYQEMQGWTLYDFKTEQSQGNDANDYDVEVIFPTALPMEVLHSLAHFNNQEIELPSWSFERYYFKFIPDSASLQVEFVSIDGRQKATAVINDSSHYKFLQSFMNDGSLQEFVSLDGTETNIYIPKKEMKLSTQTTTLSAIDPHTLVSILFNVPSVVNQSTSSKRGTIYYTDSSQLRVSQDGSSMEFVSPDSEDTILLSAEDLLNRSIVNINGHNGWTDEYNLMEINMEENSVTYQMYYQGYPVFSSSNLNMIEQKWNTQRLVEYHRPLFKINVLLNENTVDLPSSGDIINYLSNHSKFSLENISDIQIGYQLDYKSDEKYIAFEPGWFMKYNGVWREIKFDDVSGIQGGGN